MEAEQQTQENGEATKGGNYMCRQSSTRWTPTPEQIRILKDLYYNRGVRSPNGEQIQSISATLRQYGKIEGKNVFYWFQNHKARERQKKRFTADHHHHHQLAVQAAARPTPPIPNPSAWTKPSNPTPNSYIYSNFTSSGFFPASSSSATGIAVGQMGSYGYGMEKSFRECSISAGGGGSRAQNSYGWVANNGIDPYYNTFFEQQKPEEQDEEDKAEEIETLPLFPTQREDIMSTSGFCNSAKYNGPNSCYSYSFYGSDDHAFVSANSAASLELSLNSYASQGSDC